MNEYDTPMTDKASAIGNGTVEDIVSADFARGLERNLYSALKDNDRKTHKINVLVEENRRLLDELKQLNLPKWPAC